MAGPLHRLDEEVEDLLTELENQVAILLPEADVAQAVVVAERLRLALAEAAVPDGEAVIRLTASFGVAGLTPDETTADAALLRADAAAYDAKPGGKRCLLTVSVGGIVFEDQLVFDELIEGAEAQLVLAKRGGRNRTVSAG